MNFVFIYLGEECLVIIYSVSELAMGKVPVCFEPDFFSFELLVTYALIMISMVTWQNAKLVSLFKIIQTNATCFERISIFEFVDW